MGFAIDREVDVAAPAHVVWQVITDLPAYGQWNTFVPECRSTMTRGIQQRAEQLRFTQRP